MNCTIKTDNNYSNLYTCIVLNQNTTLQGFKTLRHNIENRPINGLILSSVLIIGVAQTIRKLIKHVRAAAHGRAWTTLHGIVYSINEPMMFKGKGRPLYVLKLNHVKVFYLLWKSRRGSSQFQTSAQVLVVLRAVQLLFLSLLTPRLLLLQSLRLYIFFYITVLRL